MASICGTASSGCACGHAMYPPATDHSILKAMCGAPAVQACFVLCSPQCKELAGRIPADLLNPSSDAEDTTTANVAAAAATASKKAAMAADLAAAREAEAIVDAADGFPAAQTNGKRARRPSAAKQVHCVVPCPHLTPRIHTTLFSNTCAVYQPLFGSLTFSTGSSWNCGC